MRSSKIHSWSAGVVAESKPISPFPKIPIRGIEGNNFLWKLSKIRIMAYVVLLHRILRIKQKQKKTYILMNNEYIFGFGIVMQNLDHLLTEDLDCAGSTGELTRIRPSKRNQIQNRSSKNNLDPIY